MPRGLDRRGGRARRRLDGVLFKKRPTMSDGDDGEEDRATASQLRQIPHVPSSARAVMGNSLKSTGTEKAVRSLACKDAGVSQQSYYRWRKEYGGLEIDQAKRMKELERESIICWLRLISFDSERRDVLVQLNQ